MPAPFPLLKLGAVFLKQISKPIANAAAKRAKSHPFFRTYVCMPPAQFYNWCEIKLKMWVLNLGKPVNIPILSEAMAIELGSSLLGESIVFLIAAGIIISEYNRSAKKDAAKEQARKDEINNLIYQLQELYFKVEKQETQLREMNRAVLEKDSQKSIFTRLNLGSKSGKDKSTPPPEAPIIFPVSNERNDARHSDANTFDTEYQNHDYGLILSAVQMIQNDLRGNENENAPRKTSFVTNALCYIEQEVYCRPVAV